MELPDSTPEERFVRALATNNNPGQIFYDGDDVIAQNGHLLMVVEDGRLDDYWGLHNEIVGTWEDGAGVRILAADSVKDGKLMDSVGVWSSAKPKEGQIREMILKTLPTWHVPEGDPMDPDEFVMGVQSRTTGQKKEYLFLPMDDWGARARMVCADQRYVMAVLDMGCSLWGWKPGARWPLLPFEGNGLHGWLAAVNLEPQQYTWSPPQPGQTNYLRTQVTDGDTTPRIVLQDLHDMLCSDDQDVVQDANKLLTEVMPDDLVFGVKATRHGGMNEFCLPKDCGMWTTLPGIDSVVEVPPYA